MGVFSFLPSSRFIEASERGSSVLIVSFRVLRGRIDLNETFDLGQLPYDTLQLSSPYRQWFADGIPETADHPGAFEDGLRRFIASGRYQEVVFFGQCAGANGAVDFGLRCGATAIVVTALESLFGLCPYFNRVVARPAADTIRRRMREWPAISRSVSPAIYSFYGAESVQDLLYARACRRQLGAAPLFVRQVGHHTAMREKLGLPRFLRNLAEHRDLGIESHLVDVDLKRLGPFALAYRQAGRRRLSGYEVDLVPRDEVERYVLATLLFRLGQPQAAELLLRESPDEAISEQARLFMLARTLIANGATKELPPILQRLAELAPQTMERLRAFHPKWTARQDEIAASQQTSVAACDDDSDDDSTERTFERASPRNLTEKEGGRSGEAELCGS